MVVASSIEKLIETVEKPGSAWLLPMVMPKGRELKNYQWLAVQFALEEKDCYLGLDPGLGKAVCAVALATLLGQPMVIVTPPFLVQNLTREFSRWAPEITVAAYRKSGLELSDLEVLIVPDSILTRPEVGRVLEDFVKLHRVRRNIQATLIVDEAHRFKEDGSQRSKALYDEIAPLFDRRILMSGTPMPNRAMELYPVLSRFAPEAIENMSYWDFGKAYCDPKRKVIGWDKFLGKPKTRWEFKGSSNMRDLAARVIYPSGRYMLRVKKTMVKLPPKVEEIFVLSGTLSARVYAMQADLFKKYKKADDLVRAALETKGATSVPTYRRLLALEKVKPAAEYVSALLEETEESILVFGIHIEALERLASALKKYKPFLITGATPVDRRQEMVDEFQSSGLGRRLFLGNILAMGVGLTLTKATRVLMFEASWVPAENDQAIDRAHRIGQEETVLAQYMVYAGSVDEKVLESNFEKRKSMRFV